MDENILEIIEFDKIREELVKLSPSSLSKEKSLQLTPSSDPEIITQKLTETEEACNLLEKEISTPLGETYDIRSILKKAEKDSILTAKEFLDLANSLETYKKMHHYFEGERHLLYPELEGIASLIVPQDQLIQQLRQVFDESGEIKDQASARLARIRSEKESIKGRIRKTFQRIIQDSDISNYLQDSIITQRNGRYVVPVKEEYRYKFSGIVHDRSSSGQTLFMEPMVSVELNNDLTELILSEKKEIQEILSQLTGKIKKASEVIRNNCKLATDIECIIARAKLALSMNGVRAVYSDHGVLDLKQARHPLIPADKVVPVSLSLGKEFNILIITGSNAGGKTIAMKTVGLLAAMNQSGLFIPAAEGSKLPVYKHIYAIIGDDQSIQENLSTFSSYITQLSSFLPVVSSNDLFLLDELGSGTDPIEGAALAQSVTEYMQMKGVSGIITSHFREMKELAYKTKGISNAFVEFDEKTFAPTYRLIIGVAGNSNAFNICQRFGVPDIILKRALQLKSESPFHNMDVVMARLNQQSHEMNQEKEALEKNLSEAQELRKQLEMTRNHLYEKRDLILEKARAEAENRKRELRIQSENIIKELRKNISELSKKQLEERVQKVRGKIDKIDVPERLNRRERLDGSEIKKGTYVYIDTIESEGTIISISRNQVTVQCGLIQVKVTPDHLFKTKKPKNKGKNPYSMPRKNNTSFSVATVHTEINVIGKTVDEAVPEIDRFLNECFMAGVSPVRIIHGKGTGSLRKGIQNYIRTLNFVSEFHEADSANGGMGVTEVYF